MSVVIQNLAISRQSYEILVASRGDLWHMRGERGRWLEGYHQELQKTVDQISFRPTHILDIGSGLGAIDLLFAKTYGSDCTLVDGEAGANTPSKHAEPWVSRFAVECFWRDNGMAPPRYLNPDQLGDADPIYDLVLSTRSWCFHYPPQIYLPYVLRHTCSGSMVMVDMRCDRRQWRDAMGGSFDEIDVVEQELKFDRIRYMGKGMAQ